MSRTITAFYDTRPEAEAAKARLEASRIDADRVRITDQTTGGSDMTGTSSSDDNRGFWSSMFSSEDAYTYQEGINRGGVLLTAEVDEDETDEAVRILEESNSVDLDSRESEWRSQGWSGYQGSTGAMGGMSATDRTDSTQSIPIVEEQLRVGKREVERGGARVRSYVRETPVNEQVSLREEQVNVERRPVDQPISAADLQSGDMLRDRTIEMTATSEEAVVDKQARVVEEVVVSKTAGQRTEQVNDTVRRTEVEVDQPIGSNERSAFGSTDRASQGGMLGDRDNDGTPNALDTTDRTKPGGSREGGLTGDRDRDGTPNVLDTTDRTRRT